MFESPLRFSEPVLVSAAGVTRAGPKMPIRTRCAAALPETKGTSTRPGAFGSMSRAQAVRLPGPRRALPAMIRRATIGANAATAESVRVSPTMRPRGTSRWRSATLDPRASPAYYPRNLRNYTQIKY